MKTHEFIPFLEGFVIDVLRRPQTMLLGSHESSHAGRGQDIIDRREYDPEAGDQMTDIDWIASNVQGQLVVRRYQESRLMPVAIVIDCLRSMEFGSGRFTKKEKALLAASAVGVSALEQRDPLGLFSLGLEKEHWGDNLLEDDLLIEMKLIHRQNGLDAVPVTWGHNFSAFCDIRHLVVVFSDFLNLPFWESVLPVLSSRHDVVVCIVQDRLESVKDGEWLMPSVSTLRCSISGGGERALYSSSISERSYITECILELHASQRDLCRRLGIDMMRFWRTKDIFSALHQLFALREGEEPYD